MHRQQPAWSVSFSVGQEKNFPCVVSTLKITASNMNPKTLSSPLMAPVATRRPEWASRKTTKNQEPNLQATPVLWSEHWKTLQPFQRRRQRYSTLVRLGPRQVGPTSYLTSTLLFLVYTIPFCNPRTSTACPLPFSTWMPMTIFNQPC